MRRRPQDIDAEPFRRRRDKGAAMGMTLRHRGPSPVRRAGSPIDGRAREPKMLDVETIEKIGEVPARRRGWSRTIGGERGAGAQEKENGDGEQSFQPALAGSQVAARIANSSKATMLVILIIGLTAGPAVSL